MMIKPFILSVLLGPLTGVALSNLAYLALSDHYHLGSMALNHPFLSASLFMAEVFFVYATGGAGWGFAAMWIWVLIGIVVNFVVMTKPWQWMDPPARPR